MPEGIDETISTLKEAGLLGYRAKWDEKKAVVQCSRCGQFVATVRLPGAWGPSTQRAILTHEKVCSAERPALIVFDQ